MLVSRRTVGNKANPRAINLPGRRLTASGLGNQGSDSRSWHRIRFTFHRRQLSSQTYPGLGLFLVELPYAPFELSRYRSLTPQAPTQLHLRRASGLVLTSDSEIEHHRALLSEMATFRSASAIVARYPRPCHPCQRTELIASPGRPRGPKQGKWRSRRNSDNPNPL